MQAFQDLIKQISRIFGTRSVWKSIVYISRLRPCRRSLGCWLVVFSLFGFVFLNVSTYAGSLASGCSFSGNFFKQQWFPKRTWSFLVREAVMWQAWCVHFGVVGEYFGSLGHPGGPREQQKGHLGFWSRIFDDFKSFLEPHFGAFPALRNIICVFSMLVCSFLF